jgi:glutathione S-transferase
VIALEVLLDLAWAAVATCSAMSTEREGHAEGTIIGRSSSHFTRVARIFAAELGVGCSFQVVRDLMSSEPSEYGGNPALKMPTLRTPHGLWFGALNICRELSRQSTVRRRIVWPEDLDRALPANAQELVVQAMATEVTLIVCNAAREDAAGGAEHGAPYAKMRKSLVSSMTWLESNATQAVAALPPDRHLSYLEVTLFCLVTHLEFRGVLSVAAYPALNELCRELAARASAQSTTYRFDT